MGEIKYFDHKEYGGCMISGFAGRFGYEQPQNTPKAYSKNTLTKVYVVLRGATIISCHYSLEGAQKKQKELLEIQADFLGKKAIYPIKERYYELFKTKPEMHP